MRQTFLTPWLWLIGVVLTAGVGLRAGAEALPQPSGGALAGQRFRLIVSSDIGGSDPDDFQSMVHLLVYADRFDIEGLIASPPGDGRVSHILEAIDVYETDFQQLTRHSVNFPTPASLRAVAKQGATLPAPAPGFSVATEGSQWIVQQARRDDPRALWILVWGSITDVAQALHDAPEIAPRLRIYFISSWNRHMDRAARDYLVEQHPQLWLIECDTTFRGMYVGGQQAGEWDNHEFVARSVRGHGALGDYFYQKKSDIKMGDTPSLLYLLRGEAESPASPSWGGSFIQPDPQRSYWTDDPNPALQAGRFPGAKTVNRWRVDFLRDWQQRMAWLKAEAD